jgi:hypothetical protein
MFGMLAIDWVIFTGVVSQNIENAAKFDLFEMWLFWAL